MKSDWEKTINGELTDGVWVEQTYEPGEMRPEWYGRVWYIKTETSYYGTRDFVMVPSRSDEETDPIMVVPVQDGPRSSRIQGSVFETDEPGVPYREAFERFVEHYNEEFEL